MVAAKRTVLVSTPAMPRRSTPNGMHASRLDHRSPVRPGGSEPACADKDPSWFWPADAEAAEAARHVCGTCPIRDACLDAGRAGSEWGVWGGVLLERGRPTDELPGVRC